MERLHIETLTMIKIGDTPYLINTTQQYILLKYITIQLNMN